MDWSPILISMKTARVSIVITFFLGILAPLVLPPTVAGFFLLYLFGVKRPIGIFF